jgi:hypothetical protein
MSTKKLRGPQAPPLLNDPLIDPDIGSLLNPKPKSKIAERHVIRQTRRRAPDYAALERALRGELALKT